jgi:hypothetical protein
MKKIVLAAALLGGTVLAGPATADGPVGSTYTKLDLDTGCEQISSNEVGGSFRCAGHDGYPVHFAEGDLRQSVFFGHVGDWHAERAWESFGQFNYVNDTIEWRLKDGVPFAAILRWFIENPNPDTGSPDEAHRGQVLVVSRVAQPADGNGCVVGYVDALANGDANTLARQVADTLAEGFACRADEPRYHGNRGPLGGDPTRVFGD